MKKKILLISSVVVILIIITILLKLNITQNKNVPNEQLEETALENNTEDNIEISIEQNIYPVGNYDLNDESKNKLITNYDEFKSYLSSTYSENFDELIAKYSESFFEGQALALAYIKLDSPEHFISIDSLNIDENNLEIGYSIIDNPQKDSSYTAYIAVVETDKTLSSVTSAKK